MNLNWFSVIERLFSSSFLRRWRALYISLHLYDRRTFEFLDCFYILYILLAACCLLLAKRRWGHWGFTFRDLKTKIERKEKEKEAEDWVCGLNSLY